MHKLKHFVEMISKLSKSVRDHSDNHEPFETVLIIVMICIYEIHRDYNLNLSVRKWFSCDVDTVELISFDERIEQDNYVEELDNFNIISRNIFCNLI